MNASLKFATRNNSKTNYGVVVITRTSSRFLRNVIIVLVIINKMLLKYLFLVLIAIFDTANIL